MDKHDDNRTAEEQEQERDEMLLQLLKTPPQPRPKWERGDESKPKKRPAKKG